jgi:hypothetical protein
MVVTVHLDRNQPAASKHVCSARFRAEHGKRPSHPHRCRSALWPALPLRGPLARHAGRGSDQSAARTACGPHGQRGGITAGQPEADDHRQRPGALCRPGGQQRAGRQGRPRLPEHPAGYPEAAVEPVRCAAGRCAAAARAIKLSGRRAAAGLPEQPELPTFIIPRLAREPAAGGRTDREQPTATR